MRAADLRRAALPDIARRVSVAAIRLYQGEVAVRPELELRERPHRREELVRLLVEGRGRESDARANPDRPPSWIYETKMNVAIKMTGRLYDEIRHDLERPHPFAS